MGKDAREDSRGIERVTSVHNFINKWIMRVKEARTVLTVGLWSIMAVVQVMGFLRPYLSGQELIAVAALMGLGGVIFTYLYDKMEFMKGEQMERIRRKQNFVGENMVLNHLGMIYFFSEAFDKDKEKLMDDYRDFVKNYHQGVDMEDFR